MKVFISHPFFDEKLAQTLQKFLREQGIDAYMAQRVKEYELKIDKKVIQEILNSDYVVAIITKNTRESASVNQELGYAQGKSVPRIAMVEEEAKVGILLHGMDSENFTRNNFNKKCIDVRSYLLIKKIQPKISDENKKMLKQDVYIPLYNDMKKLDSKPTNLTVIPPNPWKNLEPHQILTVEDDIKKLFAEYISELEKWEKMFLEINEGYEMNKRVLGNTLAPAFSQEGLLENNGMIRIDESSTQEPHHWIEANKIIVFDNTITDEKTLRKKLYEYTDLTNPAAKRYLQYWDEKHPIIFHVLVQYLPELWRALRIEGITHSKLSNQRKILSGKISNIVSVLEAKIKN